MGMQNIDMQLSNRFEEWKQLSNVLYAVKDHFWGVMNIQDGRMVFPCRFDRLLYHDDEIIISQEKVWGYIGEDGYELINPVYESVTFYSDGYSLATRGSNAPFTKNPMLYFDLFDDSGDLIMGNIKGFFYLKAYGLFQFFVGGKYELIEEDLHSHFNFDPSGGRYIITDKNLRSFFPQEDGSYYQFQKGTVLSLKSSPIRKILVPKKDWEYTYEANFPIEISLRKRPRYAANYLLTSGKASSRAINLLSRKSTREFDMIQPFDKDCFVVEEKGMIGVIDEDNRPIIPLKYDVLTRPVNGFLLGFQFENEITKNGKSHFNISVNKFSRIYLINIKDLDSEPRLVSFHQSSELSEYMSLKWEYYLLHCINDKTGLDSLAVRDPKIFDNSFATQISKAPYEEEAQNLNFYSTQGFFANMRIKNKVTTKHRITNAIYWFSSSRFDKEVDSQEKSEHSHYGGCQETKHYNDFNGSYAQDIEGYSDEDIYDAFDGEADAYWNID